MIVYSYTAMIRTSDGAYPVYLSDFRAQNPNISIGPWVYSENLVEFGYFPVIETTPPTGDVVTEGVPSFNDQTQEWEQTWISRDFTPEEIATNLATAKQLANDQAFSVLSNDLQSGLPYPSGGVDYQVRVMAEDLTLLLSIKSVVEADGDQSTEVYPYKFINGYKGDFTHAEMVALIEDVTRSHYGLMKSYWEFLASVSSAADIASIPTTPGSFL